MGLILEETEWYCVFLWRMAGQRATLNPPPPTKTGQAESYLTEERKEEREKRFSSEEEPQGKVCWAVFHKTKGTKNQKRID